MRLPLSTYIMSYRNVIQRLPKHFNFTEQVSQNGKQSEKSPSIFLSTETESVVGFITSHFSDTSAPVFSFSYKRIERLEPMLASRFDLVPSLANLYVSLQADAFVGTFSSNWCRLQWDLGMNRGDGSVMFESLDGLDHYLW